MLRYFEIDGCRLAALPLGEQAGGDPIVLLHGVTHSVYFWAPDPLYARLGPCWALSLPGHFPALTPPALRHPVTAASVADPLATLLERLFNRKAVTLIGLSTGGFAALAMAARHPQLVRRVIAISAFAHGRWTGSFGALQRLARGGASGQALFRATAGISGRSSLFVRMLMATAGPGWNYRPLTRYPYFEAVMEAIMPAISALDSEMMLAYFGDLFEVDISPLLPLVNAPTLVIAGGRDPIVPPAEAQQIAAAVPHAELKLFPAAGHLPNFEHYAEFSRLVEDWLAHNG